MAANRNSSLVFDFPEPAPRFEFNDAFSSPSSGGKRGGRRRQALLGRKTKARAGGDLKDSPSKSTGTATTASLGSSLDSLGGSPNSSLDSTPEKPDGGAAGRQGSPAKQQGVSLLESRSLSGDIAAGPTASQANHAPAGYSAPHFDFGAVASPNAKVGRVGSPSPSPHKRHPSSASASGYVSEASEFSFDRVTVTTNETGKSSNISWGFLDDSVLAAVGAGQDARGNPANASKAPARRTPSTGTFSNVSLSDDELDNIPCTGIVNDSAQSVVSEISERTGGDGNPGSRVKALLREGMENVRQRSSECGDGVTAGARTRSLSIIKEAKSSPSRSTDTTAKSTHSDGARSHSGGFLRDIKQNYARFKSRGTAKRGGMLQSIMEDVQFCSLYFCGVDTTEPDADAGDDDYDKMMKRKREERRREMDGTFLGKVINCGGDDGRGCGYGEVFL